MQHINIAVQPETRALKRTAAAALARRKRRFHGTEPVAILLLQSNCVQMPSNVIEDADLGPIDKVIWLVLMTNACRNGGITLLPTHGELARIANVAARQTVSSSLSILRSRRWLTVCRTTWCKGGLLKGIAYALNTMPLPIADTVYLDPHYTAFLEEQANQQRGRAQKTASAVLRKICH